MDKNKKLFPQRLWELIHDEKYNFCLRWSPDGHRVYLNRNEFEANYLKTPNNQFHTQKAISFVRQMNMYGFRKVDDCFYENDNFKRNCPQLLKNMIRRHSNKGFSSVLSDQNNHLQDEQQLSPDNHNQLYQEQMSPIPNSAALASASASATAATAAAVAVVAASASARAAANIDAESRQNAQCYRETTTTNSVGNIQAAMAAINSGSVQTPLTASSLYHRLAAINFGRYGTAPDEQVSFMRPNVGDTNSVMGHQRDSSPSIIEIDRASSARRASLELPQQQQQQHHHLDMNDLPDMSPQQSLVARQALQDTIVRSLLQLKQPQIPLSLQQNLLATIQQQSPNLLLQSLASFTGASNCPSQQQQQQQQPDGQRSSPLELVVDQTTPTNSDNVTNWCQRSFSINVGHPLPFINDAIENSEDQINVVDSEEVVDDNDDDDDEDEEFLGEDDEDYLPGVIKYDSLSQTATSLGASSSSNHEMMNYSENSENIILDLVKPSTNGRKKG